MSVVNEKIYSELVALADKELERIKKTIPDDPATCFTMVLEITRMRDFLRFGPKDEVEKYGISFQEVDVLESGWNMAVSFLFKSIRHFQGIPFMESTKETKNLALSVLYQFGCITLLKRTAEMLKSGILVVDPQDHSNRYKFSISTEGKSQFLDQMEHSYLEDLEEKLDKTENDLYKNWKLLEYDNINHALHNFGSFLSKRPKDEFSKLKIDDLESIMQPLIKPWDSGKGIMMGYDSTEELDFHFMAISADILHKCRDDAGLNPDLTIDGVKVLDIIGVVICLVSFNLKHLKFSSIASEKNKEILIFPSLTIWCSLSDLITDISAFMHMDKDIVARVFDIISLKAKDATLLAEHTSKFMPLIIDLENDFVVRPVSGILRNPLNTIKDLLSLRNPMWVREFSKDRESWLRNYLYAMFMGTRYHTIPGNIKLRKGKRNITDIDAAVYDIVTGELALFQIKWQDYHFNDIKKLRSKAHNLTEELDGWTRKVSDWISSEGINQLAKNLRLPGEKKTIISKTYLFGLSKEAVRMRGYGFELKEKDIAISTWAQFKRNRTEIGPSQSVFGDLFKALKEQENLEIKSTPKPISFRVADKELYYEDLWSMVED